MKNIQVVLAVFCLALFTGCSTIAVKRIPVNKTVDLSGRWNDTDSRLTAQALIEDLMARPLMDDFRTEHKRKPVVIVGAFKNKTDEHIDVDLFINDLERALLNSGKAKFVASRDQRGGIREERLAQNKEGHTNPKTITPMGEETGADYMLIGTVEDVKDEFGGRYVVLYQVNAELVDMRTNETVWFGQKVLKKHVSKLKYSL